MKVALVSLQGVIESYGGVAKVFFNMANNLAERGYDVTAIASDSRKGMPAFQLRTDVTFINSPLSSIKLKIFGPTIKIISSLAFNRKKRREIRQVLELKSKATLIRDALKRSSPDVIISYQQETTYLLIDILKVKVPVITMVHRDPKEYFSKPEFSLFKHSLNSCAAVQVLMPEFIQTASHFINKEHLVYIPNVVPQYAQQSALKNPIIINVSRVGAGKRQHLLVEAFEKIKDKYPNWDVEIWGWCQSDYAKKLAAYIQNKSLDSRVRFCGETSNVAQKLQNSSIFVFPSEVEGFSLALTEAMSMGLAVIGCNDCPAVRTMIKDGFTGLLASDDASDIAIKLDKLISNKELQTYLGNNARQEMKQFADKNVWDQWDSLIRKVVKAE